MYVELFYIIGSGEEWHVFNLFIYNVKIGSFRSAFNLIRNIKMVARTCAGLR
jgi:hypothetical protein